MKMSKLGYFSEFLFFSTTRSCRHAACVSQFDAAAAFDVGGRLRRLVNDLDVI
jgi:hypothetical protein